MKKEIIIDGGINNKCLHTPCKNVSPITVGQSYQDLSDSIPDDAAGLAANQIGILEKILVIRDENNHLVAFLDPEIISRNSPVQTKERCLSFPDLEFVIQRSREIRVKFKDMGLQEHEENFTDLTAVVLQHEIDHLYGISPKDRAITIGHINVELQEESQQSEHS